MPHLCFSVSLCNFLNEYYVRDCSRKLTVASRMKGNSGKHLLVQKLRKTVRRTDTIGVANPLTGLIYCADCGAKMRNKRAIGKTLKPDPSKRGKLQDRHVCSKTPTDIVVLNAFAQIMVLGLMP